MMKTLTGETPAFLFTMSSDMQIWAANEIAVSLFGLPLDRFKGMNLLTLLSAYGSSNLRHKAEESIKAGTPALFEDERNGRIIQYHILPAPDKGGQPSPLAVFAMDITRKHQYEDAGRVLEKRQKSFQKMASPGDLMDGIAHELSNVLWGIQGYAQMALDDLPHDSATRSNVEEIMKASMRAKDLLSQNSAYPRQGTQEKERVELSAVLEETLQFLKNSIPHNIKLSLRIKPGQYPVYANPTKLYRMVLKLCANAFQTIGNHPGEIVLKLEQVSPPQKTARSSAIIPAKFAKLTILNSGQGVADSESVNRTAPFYTAMVIGDGNGIGLPADHGIVADHGGLIEVKNTPGLGTGFDVYIPLTEWVPQEYCVSFKMPPRGDERVLFVDDEANLVSMIKRYMAKLGYDFVGRTSPKAALSDFIEDPDGFDLVVADLMMHEMDGLSLARWIREIRNGIPILLCTGFSADLPQVDLEKIGNLGVLAKPIDIQEFAVKIRYTLDLHS